MLKPVSSPAVTASAGWPEAGVTLLAAGDGGLGGIAVIGGTAEDGRSGRTVQGGWNSKGAVRSSVSE